MKIKSVTIQGMHKVDKVTYNFDNLNYLCGKNGAGKSTALQAVQLALFGYIPNVTTKTKESVMRHANNPILLVSVVLDDGSTEVKVTRGWFVSGKDIKTSFEVTPTSYAIEDVVNSIELPIFNFSDFLALSANQQKDWFINFLPNVADNIDWKHELESSSETFDILDKDLIASVDKEVSKYPAGVEGCRNAETHVKQMLSFKKSELQRVRNTIQSLVHYDDAEPVEDEQVLKDKLAELQDQYNEGVAANAIIKQNDEVKSKLESIKLPANSFEEDERIEAMNQESETLVAKENDLKYVIQDIDKKLHSILSEVASAQAEISIKNRVIESEGVCPYTSTVCDSIKVMIDTFRVEIADAEKSITAKQKEAEELKLQGKDHNIKLQEIHGKIQSINFSIREIKKEYDNYAYLKSLIKEVPGNYFVLVDVDDIKLQIASIQETLNKIAANNQYNKLSDNLVKQQYTIEQTIEILKVWQKHFGPNGLQSELAEVPFRNMEESMNKYLSVLFDNDVTCHFLLSEKSNSFSFGINRRGKYIAFECLSSGEKCLFTLCMMMCIVHDSKSPLNLVMVDDLLDHLDDTNIENLFVALDNVDDMQFILAGVKSIPNHDKLDVNLITVDNIGG